MATAPNEGYDHELFTSTVPMIYNCSKCKKVLRDPQRVSCCEEEYCKECIDKVIRDKIPCPNQECGNKDNISFSKARRTKRLIDQLRCYCSNRREGCEWEGELQELNDHLNENPTNENQLNGCDFTLVHCQWCQKILPRNKIGEHQENVCQLRPFTCQYCIHQDTYQRVMTIHLPKCPRQPVECPQGCGLSPERQNLAAHKAEECPNTILKCKIPGCEERRQRKDMPAHNREYAVQHVELLSQKVSELEGEAEQRKKEQNARYLPVTVTMKNYEQLLTGRDRWMSRLLYTEEKGYAIFLSVYVGGYGFAGLMNNISVYVHVTRGEYDDELQWPCQLGIEVSLLNQNDDGDKVTKICDIQARKAAQSRCSGWQSFIKERNAQRYVKDNCLKFTVSNITQHNDILTSQL